MNITIFPTGKGGAKSAVEYLLSDTDHAKKQRSVMPELLCGDPLTFAEIANCTNRKHKYTSGVIAFRDGAETRSISQDQITALIETFRSTFLPGLKVDENFADFWVMHRDKGNLELHFLVANTELVSGQQLNIHPPGEKNIQFFNAFVSVANDRLGFAQVVPDPLKISLRPFEAKSPNGKKDKRAKCDLAKVLHSEIAEGLVANRDQLIGFLKKHGCEVPRIGHDYISVRLPGAKKNMRLQGLLFSKDSDYQHLIKQHHASKVPKFLSPSEAEQMQAKLAAGIHARTEFNQHRYLRVRPGANRRKVNTPTITSEIQDVQVRIKPVRSITTPKSIQETVRDLIHVLSKSTGNSVPQVNNGDTVGNTQPERADVTTIVMGEFSVAGLQTQIGSLSMQYHTLMLLLAGASGRRAGKIRSQLIALEQQLSALNLELKKKQAQLADDQRLKIR